jgi:lipoprotein-releasing system permease protein
MWYQLKIAFRYLFSKKSTNAINIVTWISMLGMCFGAFALVVVLSVFNGFEHLVVSLYNSFYPEIQITAAKGKFFYDSEEMKNKVSSVAEVQDVTAILEENAYVQYADKDYLAVVKGVDEHYLNVTGMQQTIRVGKFILQNEQYPFAVLGANIAAALSLNVERVTEPMTINIPRSDNVTLFNPQDAFYSASIVPGGVFSIQQEFDSKYIFVSLGFIRNLMGEEHLLSAYELKLKPGAKAESVRVELNKILGNSFTVKTKYQQKETLYKIMKMERWAVYAILTFIMIIVSFNIIGSLYMVVLDKRKDISILKSMGASTADVQTVFVLQGVLAALIGAGIGIILAVIICILQMQFGFVKLGSSGSTFVVESYPVKLMFSDILLTFFTVVVISAVASFLPSRVAAKSAISFKD